MLDSGLWTGRSGLDAGRWTTTGFSAQSTTGVSFYYMGMASGQWDQWHGPAGCRMSFLLRAGNRYRTLRCANRSINYQYNFSFGPPPGPMSFRKRSSKSLSSVSTSLFAARDAADLARASRASARASARITRSFARSADQHKPRSNALKDVTNAPSESLSSAESDAPSITLLWSGLGCGDRNSDAVDGEGGGDGDAGIVVTSGLAVAAGAVCTLLRDLRGETDPASARVAAGEAPPGLRLTSPIDPERRGCPQATKSTHRRG